jgi:GTP-binding protein LepA
MEIVQERLEREYDLDLIVTAPSVVYRVTMIDGSKIMVDNPATLPDPQQRTAIEEPYVKLEMYAPNSYNGTLMELCQERRGEYIDMKYITTDRVTLTYEMPLAEVVTDFFDQMKSRTKGYASMEYHLIGYRRNELVRLDVLINGRRRRSVGRICMDQLVVDLGPGAIDVAEGDEAILFGPGTSGEQTAQNWADLVGTIHYEVVTSPRGRVLRSYIETGSDDR